MLISILIALALIVIIILISAIRFRFRYDDSEKSIGVSYLIARVGIDFKEKKGAIVILGIPVYRFPLDRITGVGREKKEPAAEAKPAKPKKRLKFPKFQWSDLRYLIRLFRGLKIKYLELSATGGFGDPYETGKMFGYYAMLQGIFPSIMSHIRFNPDFSKAGLHLKGRGLIYIRVYHLVIFALRVLIIKRRSNLGEKRLLKRKGVSYAQ